jgi:hypothetical protein
VAKKSAKITAAHEKKLNFITRRPPKPLGTNASIQMASKAGEHRFAGL